MEDFNPYAAPTTDLKPQRRIDDGVWSDGDLVVTTRGATMPDRCFKCNALTTWKLKRNLTWHPPLYYVFLIPGFFPYLLIERIVRKTIEVDLPLCNAHRNRRRIAIATSWLLALTGFLFVPMVDSAITDVPREFLNLVSVVVILAGIITGLVASQAVTVKRIDKRFAWIKGACSQFLAELPPAPH